MTADLKKLYRLMLKHETTVDYVTRYKDGTYLVCASYLDDKAIFFMPDTIEKVMLRPMEK